MMSLRSFLLAALAVVLPASAAGAQGAVHVVDFNDPGAFPDIASAVAAAADGDVILVRTLAINAQFTVDGKSLLIAADEGFAPFAITAFAMNNHHLDVQPGEHTVIKNLAAGQRVVLRGVSFGGLDVSQVAGQVWLEDAKVSFTSPAMQATNCASVVLHDVQVQGPNNVSDQNFFQSGGEALKLQSSAAVLHGVTADGGQGNDYTCTVFSCSNSSGFHGIALTGGSLWLAGSEASGGNGGVGGKDGLSICSPGGSGGDGVRLSSGAPQVQLRDVTTSGGTAATGPAQSTCFLGIGGDGVPGQAVHVLSGTAQSLDGTAVTLSVPSPLREQELLTVTLSGPPGTPAILIASPDSGVLTIGAVSGPLLTGVPLLVVPLGALPPSGSLTLKARVPELGAAVQAFSWTLQAITIEGGQRIAGPATSLLLLDAAL